MRKVGLRSYEFDSVYLKESGTIGGPKEKNGPLGHYFDNGMDDLYYGEKTFEKCEIKMVKSIIESICLKSQIETSQIDLAVAGDLINQNVISNYVLRDVQIPFIGIYSACATSASGLIVASTFIESKTVNNVLTFTSSHNATAERQYRYPTEYGGQKPLSATVTVTGAGGAIISTDKSKICIKHATIGKVIDAEESDPFDMGSAMAPAAFDTIITHFKDLNIKPNYYDLILTGDLGNVGKKILIELLDNAGYDIKNNHDDCGLMIYNEDEMNIFSGGSGAGCSSLVIYSYIVNALKNGIYKKVLICSTGALMNPIMLNQKETIPSICHCISMEVVE